MPMLLLLAAFSVCKSFFYKTLGTSEYQLQSYLKVAHCCDYSHKPVQAVSHVKEALQLTPDITNIQRVLSSRVLTSSKTENT